MGLVRNYGGLEDFSGERNQTKLAHTNKKVANKH